ncbi:MAG: FAD-dependent oxidoreductase [Parcubacteria group bacterium]|jgi:ferredoxin-NADP reductase
MITQSTAPLLERREIAPQTYQYFFEKPDGFDFVAGQYVFLDFAQPVNRDDRPSMRALSIASAPYEDRLMFVMRDSESAFKKNMRAMNVGDEILIKGPLGHVSIPENLHQPITFLIAGVGITPVRSMLKQEEHIKSFRPVTVIFSNKTKADIVLREDMDAISLQNFKLIHTLTREEGEWEGARGRINAEMIKENVDDITNQMYYVVGTGEFITAIRDVLTELNVPKEKIIFDNFG